DRSRAGDRHARLHVARAAPREGERRAERPLLARSPALRDDDRKASLRRHAQYGARERDPPPARASHRSAGRPGLAGVRRPPGLPAREGSHAATRIGRPGGGRASGDPGGGPDDGMTEALITNLAQIQALRVASRTSAMQYKGARKPLPQIARELRVDAVVEGTVARFGNRVRITAQLIEAASDRHIWARSYERDLRDVLALQGEVARAIADEIQVQVSQEERARLG